MTDDQAMKTLAPIDRQRVKFMRQNDWQIKKLIGMGASWQRIAQFFSIDEDELLRRFMVADRVGSMVGPERKELAGALEKVMYRRAIGGQRVFKQVPVKVMRKGVQVVEVVDIWEELPPDTAALRFMLQKLDPATYGEKQIIDHAGLERMNLIAPNFDNASNVEFYEDEDIVEIIERDDA